MDVCNSQSRMWLLPCVRRLTDILGQSETGQEIHHFGCGWVQGAVKMHVKAAQADVCVGRDGGVRELQCSNRLWN